MACLQKQLNDHPTKVLGPFGCFIWSCQILGWKVTEPLVISTLDGTSLHLLHTPIKLWRTHAAQAWVDWIFQKAKMNSELRPTTAPYLTYQSLWTHCKLTDFPFSRRFRTPGILSGSAKAQINGQDRVSCEFCDASEAGQCHLVLRCPKTQHIRDMPKYQALQHASTFTRCTGIPTGHPLTRSSVDFKPHTLNLTQTPNRSSFARMDPLVHPTCQMYVYQRGQLWLQLPRTQLSTHLLGVNPGQFHDICRAETFGVLVCLEYNRAWHIHCDNQGVVTMFQKVLAAPFNPF